MKIRTHIGDMGVVIPFPVSSHRSSSRARRIFEAQVKLEQARRQTVLFFAAASLTVFAVMSLLEFVVR